MESDYEVAGGAYTAYLLSKRTKLLRSGNMFAGREFVQTISNMHPLPLMFTYFISFYWQCPYKLCFTSIIKTLNSVRQYAFRAESQG